MKKISLCLKNIILKNKIILFNKISMSHKKSILLESINKVIIIISIKISQIMILIFYNKVYLNYLNISLESSQIKLIMISFKY